MKRLFPKTLLLQFLFVGYVLGCSMLRAEALSEASNFHPLPKASNVYFDKQGCRYLGKVTEVGSLDLYRLCEGFAPARIQQMNVHGSLLNSIPPESVMHFFRDNDYPLWIQSPEGLPYHLVNRADTESVDFALLAQILAAEDAEYSQILWRWFDNHSGWGQALSKGSQYIAMELLLLSPLLFKDVFGIARMAWLVNASNAQRGAEHIASVSEALAMLGIGALNSLSPDKLTHTMYSALKEELIFRIGFQWGSSTLLQRCLTENDDWPARQRAISRWSRLVGSSLFAAAHIYYTPSRQSWLFFRYLASSYWVNGEMFERFGLAGVWLEHTLFNTTVDVSLKSLLTLVQYMSTYRQ
ncbi:type II CAAX prenyl endopeptidase Rce1 family protein [Parendozoicomonas haliclonae]|uniref:CAAX prenyl protease 2/Lysostaphin resistance protein A-like domain-containing protein n=1 Tax=Parendozoicomonas haliclonae TaxID=1960125 RepID=A0A1X7AP22_9GAMM|nr:CPBP family glutamic-type intramembrane protease [Parendozoicomonas haliclonae]SMA50054.1 hypothetical protein EHSB41UT_03845 [Parendozoicomonas haliclonae]